MTTVINSCSKCVWMLAERACLAFPFGIPDDIWQGKNKHEKLYKGDHNIQFEHVAENSNNNLPTSFS